MIHFHVITLFPESIEPYLTSSILGRAQRKSGRPKRGERSKIRISFYDPKDFVYPDRGPGAAKHKRLPRVDDRPYGGGPGMVLEPTAILRAVEKALKKANRKKPEVIFFATDGKQFDESMARALSRKRDVVLVCGRYEGVDARVQKILKAKKVSIGPYVLTGGELPAAMLIDAVSRFVPGVLGKTASLESSRIASPDVYTRPEVLTWKGKRYKVPKVLLSGHHAAINEWKKSRKYGG